jgi:serine/threonine protein kinase
MYDITEEYDSLKQEPWWHKNQRANLFSLFNEGSEDEGFRTLSDREGITLADEDFESLETDDAPIKNTVVYASLEEPATVAEEEPVKLRTPRVQFKKIRTKETESSDSESETSYNEGGHYAEFHDFPVQMTLLERAEETLEDLAEFEFDDSATKEAHWTAWLFQIVAALSAAQHYFGFVHNDLHSNNVMWSTTDQEFLQYRVHKGKTSQLYRVPTYGKLIKIIDFGRASYTLPAPGGFFISDAFYPGNDAANQYNCEPFYTPKDGVKRDPNPSFDLCRLAVSLLDSLFPERPAVVSPIRAMSRENGKVYNETASPVYNLLWEWLLDDEGKSVLRTPEGKERYPDFDLYCALAADVHRAIPHKQIEKPLFSVFRSTVEPSSVVYDLHV